MERPKTRGSHGKKAVALLIVLTLALAFPHSINMGLRAKAVTVSSGTNLYIGNGKGNDAGMGIYTDSDMTILYEEGKATEVGGPGWSVSENTLIFNNFHYTTGPNIHVGSYLCDDTTIELVGDNSIAMSTTAGSDTFGIRANNASTLTIQGAGSLTIQAGDTVGASYGIDMGNGDLIINKASVTAKSGATTGYVNTYGLYHGENGQLVVENGARATFSGDPVAPGNGHSYGAYFTGSGSTSSKPPFTVRGRGCSLTAQGATKAIYAKECADPSLSEEPEYGVYAAQSYKNIQTEGNCGWGLWMYSGTDAYYVENQAYQTARYVQIAEAPVIQTETLAYGVVGQSYSQQMKAAGESTIQWAMDTNKAPPGLNIDRITGEITGTPTQSGTWTFTVGASNDYASKSKKFTLAVYKQRPTQGDQGLNGIQKNTGLTGSGTSAAPFSAAVGRAFGLTAVGHRQDAQGYTPYDTRYVPASWEISQNTSGTFPGGGPYIIYGTIRRTGTYTVLVRYAEEAWNGHAWAPTGSTDTKKAQLKIVALESASTPDVSRPTVTKVKFGQASVVLKQGKNITLPAHAYTNTGEKVAVTYKSSKTSVAKVNVKTGKITAAKNKTGTAKITATAGNKRATLTVKVVKKSATAMKAKSVSANVPENMKVGQSQYLKPTVKPGGAQAVKVTYKSSKPTVASVDKYGRLTAKKKGKAVITVKGGGKSGKYTVQVK